MRSKKNVGVIVLLEFANKQLSRTDEYADRNFKAGICVMIERVLFESRNYNGFSFINRDATQEQTNSNGIEFYNRHYS